MKVHKDNSGAPPFPDRQEPSRPGSELLTSEDLFGDLVDAPLPPKAVEPSEPIRPGGSRGPIRVQVSEPGVPRKPSPLSSPGEADVLPADVAALLDAFSEPAEAALRAEESEREPKAAAAETAAPEASRREAGSWLAEESPTPGDLLDILMTPEADPVADVESEPVVDVESDPLVDVESEPLVDVESDPLGDVALDPVLDVEPDPLSAIESEPDFLSDAVLDPEPEISEMETIPSDPGFADLEGFEELSGLDRDGEPARPGDPSSLAEPSLVAAVDEENGEPVPAEPALEPKTEGEGDGSLESSLQDLLNLEESLPATAAHEPPAPVKPAARQAAKFTAASAKEPERGVIDLAAVAEEALGLRRPSADTPGGAEDDGEFLAAVGVGGDYGPYRLLERIAVGGMAEVFRAKRAGVEGFEKVVAVKRILSHLSDNKEFVDMFIDEAKMVAGLSHPNIVQIFDLGRIERSYYIAMEHVHGKDLRTILRRAKERGLRMPLDISAFIVSKVCAALEYAHRKKDDRGRAMMLVHRDISPQNILISFEGDVKLTDFGIAKAATKATITDRGALRGKLLYMSPEQAWGKPLDKRSDVFSLGIVFYEMLTEQKPFLGSSEMSILETVRECRVSPPTTLNSRIPEKLERVVMKSLERDPELRYQDAGEMHRDLERVLHEWQPANASGLVRFLEVIFDEDERGTRMGDELAAVEGTGHVAPPLEVELQEPPPPAPTERPAPKDPMSIQKLLRRFGIK